MKNRTLIYTDQADKSGFFYYYLILFGFNSNKLELIMGHKSIPTCWN